MLTKIITRMREHTNHCYLCQQPGSDAVCQVCRQTIAAFGSPEEDLDFLNVQPRFSRYLPKLSHLDTLCIGPHHGVLQRLISLLKYQYKMEIANCLSRLLLTRIQRCYANLPLPEALIPVPLHPLKRGRRGFNQTELIAQHLSSSLSVPVLTRLIQKRFVGKAQAGLDGRQRRLVSTRQYRVVQAQTLRQLNHVAILDDVITTGTTMRRLCDRLTEVNPGIKIDLWSLSVSLPHQ